MNNRDKRWELGERILGLKLNLQKTDYQAIKFAEGEMPAEEYAPIKAQRQAWRDEINALESEIGALKEDSEE